MCTQLYGSLQVSMVCSTSSGNTLHAPHTCPTHSPLEIQPTKPHESPLPIAATASTQCCHCSMQMHCCSGMHQTTTIAADHLSPTHQHASTSCKAHAGDAGAVLHTNPWRTALHACTLLNYTTPYHPSPPTLLPTRSSKTPAKPGRKQIAAQLPPAYTTPANMPCTPVLQASAVCTCPCTMRRTPQHGPSKKGSSPQTV